MKRSLPFLLLLLATAPLVARPTIITGRVLGHDGKPLPLAHVHICRADYPRLEFLNKPYMTVTAHADGSYRIETDALGVLKVQFTGACHRRVEVPIVVETPRDLTIDATLETNHFASVTSFDSVKVVGSFNGYDLADARPLVKQPDGSYATTLKATGDTFTYQLVFPIPNGMWSINGTQSDSYVYDGDGDYRSVLTPHDGRITVVFDPRRLADAPGRATVTIGDASMAALSGIVGAIDAREMTLVGAAGEWLRSGKDYTDFTYDWSAEEARLKTRIATERDPLVRRALLLSYSLLAREGYAKLDPALPQRAIHEIDASSPLWRIHPKMAAAALAAAGDMKENEDYAWRVIESNPDTAVRTATMADILNKISYAREPERFMRYYRYLVERYPDSYDARYAVINLNPERAIQAGRQVPAFSVPSLDDPSVMISNASLKGKVYLIDCWATWCGPCVNEMPFIQSAYEKYHAKGFEVVSLSMDKAPSAVSRFRAGKWKMPWLNGFVEGNLTSDLAKRLEVVGIPKPMLVGADGTIIATERELRGVALERTLARVFSDRAEGVSRQ